MDRKDRRRKQKNAVKDTIRMVNSILLVVVAIAIVAFVAVFIKGQMDADETGNSSFLSGLFSNETESTEESTTTAPKESVTEEDTTDGLHVTAGGSPYYMKQGARVKNAWIAENGSIYYAGEDGLLKTGNFEEGAFRFETAEDGAVKGIRFNTAYMIPSDGSDYPYSVKSSSLTAFLNPKKTLGRMLQIMYKKTSETMSHQLGGTGAPQYTVPGSLQVAGGLVFWLPALSDPDEIEALSVNSLFCMRPGEDKRRVAARDVTGFKVLEDENGAATVYYCRDGAMYVCREDGFAEDETVIAFTEDMKYRPGPGEDGKLYLLTENGYRVTMASDAFAVGDYVYQLDATGEILGVEPQVSVEKDDYSYEVVTDEAFGVTRSVAARRKDDVQEAISSEFFGSAGNMHLSDDGAVMYAEYRDAMNNSRIIRITFDGDVDIVNGFDPGDREIVLCGNAGADLVVKVVEEDGDRYETVTTGHMTPLALGMEPVEIGAQQMEEIPKGPGDVIVTGNGPGYEKVDKGVQYSAPGQPILDNNSVGKAP